MNHNQLDGLLALKVVAEKRNFTAAAGELGISPSAMSQVIKQLELRIGVALLSRTTRTTALTEAGARFLKRAGPAMDELLSALNEVGSYAEKPSGLLRLNVPRGIYPLEIAPLVKSFLKKYPEVTVEVYLEDETTNLVERGFDAGIRLSDILEQDMVATKLFGPVRFITAGAPKYFERHGRPKHLKDLLKHNCLIARLGPNFLYDRWEFEHRGAEFQVHVKGSLILNDSLMIKKAALDGQGIIYTTEGSVADRVKAGKLEVVLAPFAAVSTGFYLYYPRAAQVQPKLRAFIEHVKEVKRKPV